MRRQLLVVKVGDHGMETEVSPSTKAAIHNFKASIDETVDAFMQCERAPGDAAAMQARLRQLLRVDVKPRTQKAEAQSLDHVFGSALSVGVSAEPDEPQLMMVLVDFAVNCGDDALLMVFEAREGQWRRALLWQSSDYDKISGAFGDFFAYQVLPQPKAGEWRLAVAHGHPWCTSRWSGFDLDIVAPATQGSSQRVLLHKSDGYVREADPIMTRTADGFQLRLDVGSLDLDLLTRRGIYRYRVAGDSVLRVQPAANNGRDFVDAWLQTPWSEAAPWSAPSEADRLRSIHEGIKNKNSAASADAPVFSYGAVLRCSDDPGHFQVELDAERFLKGKSLSSSATYFQIGQRPNGFIMLSASPDRDKQCGGVDLMQGR